MQGIIMNQRKVSRVVYSMRLKNIRIYYSQLYAYHGIKNLITSNFQVREKVSLKWP